MALPIFPGRLQPSIIGRSELNFRVRDGNGWTLALISTNCCIATALYTVTNFYQIVKRACDVSCTPARNQRSVSSRKGKAAEGMSFGLQAEANDPELALTW